MFIVYDIIMHAMYELKQHLTMVQCETMMTMKRNMTICNNNWDSHVRLEDTWRDTPQL